MPTNYYDVGDRVRISVEFRDLNGALADPTTITVKFQDPALAETVSTSSWTNTAVGKYHLDIDIDAAGDWYYRWEGTGAVVAATEAKLIARATQF